MSRVLKKRNNALLLIAAPIIMVLCFWGASASAATLVVSEGDKIEIELSLQHPTRVYFEYDGGASLFFNNADVAAADLSAPRIAATVDGKGDVYLTVETGLTGQKVSGFLTTQSGRTYIIDLTIVNKDAGQVKIVSKEAREKAVAAKAVKAADEGPKLKPVKWSRNAGHHDSVTQLMRALYFGQMPEGFTAHKRWRAKQQSKDGVTRRISVHYQAQTVEAVIYELTNNNPYFINPENQKDWFKPYIALAFETDALETGHTAKVYVLRQKAVK